jgi:hypothetical protein
MADTGAPWNIPYIEPTDLVRDYPQASEDLADAIADGLDAAGNAGIGSNVQSVIKTDTFSTASTKTYTAVTGLSVSITPSTDTAKVLVILSVFVDNITATGITGFRLMRGATPIALGDAVGNRVQASGSQGNTSASLGNGPFSLTFLDSPGVATAVTYSVEVNPQAGTAVVNRSGTDNNSDDYYRTVSTITAIEVAT